MFTYVFVDLGQLFRAELTTDAGVAFCSDNLCKDHRCTCFDVSLLDRQEDLMVSSIICDGYNYYFIYYYYFYFLPSVGIFPREFKN